MIEKPRPDLLTLSTTFYDLGLHQLTVTSTGLSPLFLIENIQRKVPFSFDPIISFFFRINFVNFSLLPQYLFSSVLRFVSTFKAKNGRFSPGYRMVTADFDSQIENKAESLKIRDLRQLKNEDMDLDIS